MAKPTESLSPLRERGEDLFGFGYYPPHHLTRGQNFMDEACYLARVDLPVLQVSIHFAEGASLEGRAAK